MLTSPQAPDVAEQMARRARWTPLEIAFWLVAFSTIYFLPGRHLILTEIAIWALFALSLDLILGYGGILSLGHAAFFGIGAYAAGLLAKHGILTEPVLALLAAGLAATVLGFLTSFLVLRGSDLTRLMVTLGVALVLRELANRYSNITGGADGLQGVTMAPVLGLFRFDLFGHTAYVYSLIVVFVLFLLARRIVNSPFGLSLLAVRGNPLRASAIGIPVDWRLVAILKGIDYGDSCVVEAEVYPVGTRSSSPTQPGPYTFADSNQATAFVTEAVDALMYLGCDVQDQ